MIQEGTMVTTTRGNPLKEHAIIVERKAINNLNVERGSTTWNITATQIVKARTVNLKETMRLIETPK